MFEAIPSADVYLMKLIIHMMCWGTGRERTGEEYAGLLKAAGWSLAGIRPMLGGLMGIVEGINAPVFSSRL
jgi:hypothetical protein